MLGFVLQQAVRSNFGKRYNFVSFVWVDKYEPPSQTAKRRAARYVFSNIFIFRKGQLEALLSRAFVSLRIENVS